MRIERHIYGSRRGYATLAHSAGLGAADCRALECLAFGTPYDPAYRASLDDAPAWWSRPVGDTRRAVTRVRPGAPDDAGRPTLLFVTAVLNRDDWDELLLGDVRPLLRCAALWEWEHGQSLAAVELPPPAPPPLDLDDAATGRVLGLLSLIELNWQARRPVVVSEEQYTADEVAAIERLLPPAARRQYSASWRSLSPELGATLTAVARGLPAQRVPLREARAPYARLLAAEGLARAEAVGQYYDQFGQPDVAFGRSPVESDMGDSHGAPLAPPDGVRLHTVVFIAVLVLMLLLGGAGGWLLRQATAAKPPPWDALLRDALMLTGQPVTEQLAALDALDERLRGPELAAVPAVRAVQDTLARARERVSDLDSVDERLRLEGDVQAAIMGVTLATTDGDAPPAIAAAEAAIEALPQGARKLAYERWLEDRQAAVQLELLKHAVLSRVAEADKATGDVPKGTFDSLTVLTRAGVIGLVDATKDYLPLADDETATLTRARARMVKYIDEQIRALLAELDAAEQDAIALQNSTATGDRLGRLHEELESLGEKLDALSTKRPPSEADVSVPAGLDQMLADAQKLIDDIKTKYLAQPAEGPNQTAP